MDKADFEYNRQIQGKMYRVKVYSKPDYHVLAISSDSGHSFAISKIQYDRLKEQCADTTEHNKYMKSKALRIHMCCKDENLSTFYNNAFIEFDRRCD